MREHHLNPYLCRSTNVGFPMGPATSSLAISRHNGISSLAASEVGVKMRTRVTCFDSLQPRRRIASRQANPDVMIRSLVCSTILRQFDPLRPRPRGFTARKSRYLAFEGSRYGPRRTCLRCVSHALDHEQLTFLLVDDYLPSALTFTRWKYRKTVGASYRLTPSRDGVISTLDAFAATLSDVHFRPWDHLPAIDSTNLALMLYDTVSSILGLLMSAWVAGPAGILRET
ncbi:hypothetical protein FPV67DRAFT_992552 [Lyophyllum atratum]|nr:hypothetical protein FPV67DRAFT_992552 [Lyophyllum atratum]